MNSTENKTENIYVEELKSLLKDKFFMMLLGISVAIVILSTVYSFVRPKTDNGQLASGEQITVDSTTTSIEIPTATPVPDAQETDRTIEGLENVEEKGDVAGKSTSIFDELKAKIKDIVKVETPAASPTPEVAVESSNNDATNAQINAQAPKKGGTYTVAEGDNLWQIAEKAYGSGYNFVDIVASNGLVNSDYLEVGQKLILPSVEAKPSTTGEITGQAAATRSEAAVPSTYTTIEGDSLWNISTKMYNSGYEWGRIASLNALPNPDFIMVGQVLKLK